MSSKDQLILEKLLKLAEKQQKVLTKLAQAVQEDIEANKQWLSSAWNIAAVNSGVVGSSPESIEYVPGGTDPNKPNVTISSTYTVTGVVPVNAREQFKRNFERHIATAKPELDGRVGMIFKDPK